MNTPKELVTFLRFVGAGLTESTDNYEDELVERLQNEVQKVKTSREMKGRYMLFEELMRDEFKAGKKEDRLEVIIEFLSSVGDVPEELRNKLESIQEIDTLRDLSKKAAHVTSMQEFEAEVNQLIK